MVSFLGICKKEDEKRIFRDKGWEQYLYLPNTLSTRLNKVPSLEDFESVSSRGDSKEYSIKIKEIKRFFKESSALQEKKSEQYLKLRGRESTNKRKDLQTINDELNKIKCKIDKLDNELSLASRLKCKIMFKIKTKAKIKDKRSQQLCIVYYVIDNPTSTTNLVFRHFKIDI